MDPLITPSLRELLGHLGRWLGALRGAGEARREASRRALQQVVLAVRETSVHGAALAAGSLDSATRVQLTRLWTELSFTLDELKLDKLAKRCRLLGQQLADPVHTDAALLAAAGARLSEIERQARALLSRL